MSNSGFSGREWNLHISVTTQARSTKRTVLICGGLWNPSSLPDRGSQALAKLLWTLCKEQAAKDCVTQEQFESSLTGDVLDAAQEALLQAVADYLPSKKREAFKTLLAKYFSLRDEALPRR